MPDGARSGRLVHLLRHGVPVGGVRYRGTTDDALSREGFAQMQRAVAGCGGFERIVTSPLRRCSDFARTLAENRGVPLTVEPAFRELHFGQWEGRTARSLMATCPEALRRFWEDPLTHPPPDGESLEAFCTRVITAWRAQLRAPGEGHLLLIVHGGVVRAILGQLRALLPRELVRLEVPYAGVLTLEVGPGGDITEVDQPAPVAC